jgi:ethanolamine utilization protein EutA (predicted chaperonin)
MITVAPVLMEGLKKRFSHLHPLILIRSRERAKSLGHLFDILDTFPDKYPVIWSDEELKWIHTDDLFLSDNY